MKKTLSLLAATAVMALSFGAAQAQDYDYSYVPSGGQNYLSLGLGYYDVFDSDDSAADIRAEYRSGTPLFWSITPWAGLEATTDGSIWAGGGLNRDIYLAPNIYLTPSAGVGLYAQGGSDKDLGHPIEFRFQIEGGYEFVNRHRVGVALGHMSNLGLDDKNPGTETFNVYYHIPVNSLFQ